MTNFRKRKMQHWNFIFRFWNHVEKSQEKEVSLRALKGSHNYNRSTLGRCFAINSNFPCFILMCIFHIFIVSLTRYFLLLNKKRSITHLEKSIGERIKAYVSTLHFETGPVFLGFSAIFKTILTHNLNMFHMAYKEASSEF